MTRTGAATRLAVIVGVFICTLAGWGVGGYVGAGIGLALGIALLVVPWRRHPVWSWAALYISRNRPMPLSKPETVTNDRSGGGVRYQDHVAITAVQVLGKAHRPTLLAGSTFLHTDNTLDISGLLPLMRQSLGLTINSLSVICAGSRRRNSGDYPRGYDTLVGPSPYAGQRETWLVLRFNVAENGDGLRWRETAGTAAVAAAQRIAASLRTNGLRARVASAGDVAELDRRLGSSALEPINRRWKTLRSDSGWMTTYAYRPCDITAAILAQAWTLRVDGVVQNITLSPDGMVRASVTLRTAQPPTASPSTALQTLPGEQRLALANTMCGPPRPLRGQPYGPLRYPLRIEIGPSGVLIGKIATGERVLVPLGDPGDVSRVHITADDSITKRLIIRTAATGERITVHTSDLLRWDSVRMPNVLVTDQPRSGPGTTVSVVDGSVIPSPRPATVISVLQAQLAEPAPADVVITQTGPGTVDVTAAGVGSSVEVELFRAENRYVSAQLAELRDLEMAE